MSKEKLMPEINKNSLNNNVQEPHFIEPPLNKKAPLLTTTKIVYLALATLATALLISAGAALAAVFTPYPAFAAISLTILIITGTINSIALGIFLLTKALELIAPKLKRPLAKVAHLIHAQITEIFSLLAMIACYPVNLEKSNPKKVGDNRQQPILLIHGLYHNSSAWIEYRSLLKKAGLGPVFTINLGNPFGSITQHAKKVARKVNEIQEITGRKDIFLVGHSMGGIVASKFALDEATIETQVTDIITIGSPLKGSVAARYIGFGKSVKEMSKGGAYIDELNERINRQDKIKFFHIASETDALVPLLSALNLENKKAKRLVISNLGHAGLLYSKRIIQPIIDYYQNRPI